MSLHSIVIPVYNEVDCLEPLFTRMKRVMRDLKDPSEVILVDDGSTDGSGEVLDRCHEEDPRFKVVHFSRNFGHQIAITAGTEYAQGDTVTFIDADLQDPPEVILEFVQKWRDGFDVVYGIRRTREGETLFKLWTAKIFYRVIRMLTDQNIPVDTGDFRLIDKKVAIAFLSLPERHRYVRGLFSWVGFKQAGIQYDRENRVAGQTHYPFPKMIKLAFDAVASFSFIPLRIATAIGFFASFGAFGGIVWALSIKFISNRAIHGWTSMMLAMFFMGGTQLFCLGMLGEYIGRTYDEVRKRPLYIIQSIKGFARAGNPIEEKKTPEVRSDVA
jgi:polyisoprenyl-phosphate glycosyltransferase